MYTFIDTYYTQWKNVAAIFGRITTVTFANHQLYKHFKNIHTLCLKKKRANFETV